MAIETVTAYGAASDTRLHGVAVRPDGTAWWDEARTEPQPRATVVRRSPDGRVEDLLLAGWSLPVEHGSAAAGSWLAPAPDTLVFLRAGEPTTGGHRLYLLRDGSAPRPLTPDDPGTSGCADLVADPSAAAVWCVREHLAAGRASRSLTTVALGEVAALRDVYTSHRRLGSPRPSPDGARIAWLEWDPDRQPWDGCELRVGELTAAGGVTGVRTLLGGAGEAVFQPEWVSPDTLYAVSDRTYWWNLYEVSLSATLRPLGARPEEFGWPQVEPGLATYGRLADGRLAVLHGTDEWRLDLLDPASGTITPLELPFTAWQPTLRTAGGLAIGVAGGPSEAAGVVLVDTATGRAQLLHSAGPGRLLDLPPAHPVAFLAADGREVHAVVHPPSPVPGEPARGAPYLLVLHDGPGAAHLLDSATAAIVRSGIGVAEVDCRGSAGYGRAYRELPPRDLAGQAEDCAVVARGLALDWAADAERLVVKGLGTGAAVALHALAGGGFAAGVAQADDLGLGDGAVRRPWMGLSAPRPPLLLLPREPQAAQQAAELAFYRALLTPPAG